MKVLSTKRLYQASAPSGRVYLSVWQRQMDSDGNEFPYFMVCRGGDEPVSHEDKRPDAVIVVAFAQSEDGEPQLVLTLTNEFLPPIGRREISFPAGLLDDEDYAGDVGHRIRSSYVVLFYRRLPRAARVHLDYRRTAHGSDRRL